MFVKAQNDDTTKYSKYPNTYGIQYPRLWATKILRVPTDTTNGKMGVAIVGNTLYIGNGNNWNIVSGTSIDTTSISNRINLRVKYTDTSAMLSSYQIAINSKGTVTNIATGLGLTGGNITTSGTVGLDTANVSVISRQRAAATYQTIVGSIIGNSPTITSSKVPLTYWNGTNHIGYTNGIVGDSIAGNLFVNNLIERITSVASSSTPISITASSIPNYVITGSANQVFNMANATTLPKGATFTFNNNGSAGVDSIRNSSGTLIVSVPNGGYATLILNDSTTAAGNWDYHFGAPSSVQWSTNTFNLGNASITNASWNGSVIGSNKGGAGSVTGILKADGSGNVSTATSGAANDYLIGSSLSATRNVSTGSIFTYNSSTGAYNLDTTKYQQPLVSGTNIKTINGSSILGSGDLTISGGLTGAGTAAAVAPFAFWGTTNSKLSSTLNKMGWDTTNYRLGLGTSAPQVSIDNRGNYQSATNDTSYQNYVNLVYSGSLSPTHATAFGVYKQASVLNIHAFEDWSVLNQTSGTGGYASFDAQPIGIGSSSQDHLVGLQSRPIWSSTGNVNYMAGVSIFSPSNKSSGGISNYYGVLLNNISNTGGGTVTNNYGIYLQNVTNGTAINRAIYSAGGASEFSGDMALNNSGTFYSFSAGTYSNQTNSKVLGILSDAGGSEFYTIGKGTYSSSVPDFIFNKYNGIAITEIMRLKSGGNLLLGTATDDNVNKLQVIGSVKATSFNSNATQSTVSASTSGTVIFSMTGNGSSEKKIVIYCNNATGTATYSFPSAFTYTPGIIPTYTTAGSFAVNPAVVTSLSTTSVTLTCVSSTGVIILNGY